MRTITLDLHCTCIMFTFTAKELINRVKMAEAQISALNFKHSEADNMDAYWSAEDEELLSTWIRFREDHLYQLALMN